MKKRHKALIVVGAGALVYGVGIMLGVSFLNNTQAPNQQIASQFKQPSYVPQETPENISKWVAEIHPAAGEEPGE